MNEQDGFRIEAAEQFGFEEIDGQDGPGQPGYFCTEAELLAFAKACERAGRHQASVLARANSEPGQCSFEARRGLRDLAEELDALNGAADAELKPTLDAAETRLMTAAGYVRGDVLGENGWVHLATYGRPACTYCGPGKHTGLPGNACENCMNTGLANPTAEEPSK